MYAENLDYLSRPSPSSPLLYKKSPPKYNFTEPKFVEPYTLNKSLSHLSTEDWSVNDFQNLKKVADDVGNLRQTFDGRTQSKVQQILSKYDYDNDQSGKGYHKPDLNLRQTFNARPRYIETYRLSTPNAPDNLAQFSNTAERQNKNMRSPMRSEKLQLEYNKYKEQLEELETTKKMAEELRKLKEDRRKRLEANLKQAKPTQYKKQESGDFKRKKYEEFYSPKYEKIDVNQNLELSKTVPIKKLNLQRYKIGSEYELPNNAEQESLQKSKSFLQTSEAFPVRTVKEVSSALLPSRASRRNSVVTHSLIDDFVVGKFLGEGRFGTVHQVFHKGTGAIFAMKKIPKENVKKLNMVNQLIKELKIQTYLHHKNIVALYHSFDDANYIYLLMEYMEQGTLFSQLKKKKVMPENEVAKKIKEVSSAVKYLHENQIAHRDIKPQNIVVTHGVCKLCDFGWATICDSRRKTAIGTLDYIAPEIVEGEEYDESVDIWCLGVLTYELLIGKAPFYHIRRQETKKRILSVEKTAINYPENISKNATSFIDSLLKKDPAQRLCAQDLLSQPFLQVPQEDF